MAILVGTLVSCLVFLASSRPGLGTEPPARAPSSCSSSSTSSSSWSPTSRASTRRRRPTGQESSRRSVSLLLPSGPPHGSVPADAGPPRDLAGICENLLSFDPTLAETLVKTTTSMKWLIDRMLVAEYDSNKQYASEVRLADALLPRLERCADDGRPPPSADPRHPAAAEPVKPPSAGRARRHRCAAAGPLGPSRASPLPCHRARA